MSENLFQLQQQGPVQVEAVLLDLLHGHEGALYIVF